MSSCLSSLALCTRTPNPTGIDRFTTCKLCIAGISHAKLTLYTTFSVFTALKIFMDLNPAFFDECTANYKQRRLQDRQLQRHRDEAWVHLRETVLQNARDPSQIPANINDPIPSIELGDITLLEDDYSFEGDEQMSMEGGNMTLDEQGAEMHLVQGQGMDHEESNDDIMPEAGSVDQHGELRNFPQRARADHVRRKSVIPLTDDVMRE